MATFCSTYWGHVLANEFCWLCWKTNGGIPCSEFCGCQDLCKNKWNLRDMDVDENESESDSENEDDDF